MTDPPLRGTVWRMHAFSRLWRSRSRRIRRPARDLLRFDDLTLDRDAHAVHRDGRPIDLTPTEFRLLELFLHHPNQVLDRGRIFEEVWGFDFGGGSNTLAVYMGYLRRKTEAAGEPRLLHNVRGVGYVLRRAGPLGNS